MLPIIHGARTFQRPPMGFWHRTAPGIRTPAAEWMAELLEAQQAGGDLEPHPASQMAAKLPNPPHPMDSFPGHAAWIEGGWKLHRIERGEGPLAWELYDLEADPGESNDRYKPDDVLAGQLKAGLQAWLVSVVQSFNGEDYQE